MTPTSFPPWWPVAGIDAKAAWLVSTYRVRSYSEACAFLSRLRKSKPRKPRNASASAAYSSAAYAAYAAARELLREKCAQFVIDRIAAKPAIK